MKLVVGSAALTLALLTGCTAMPGSASREEKELAAHHPPGAAAAAPAGHDRQMKMMQEMHQKMAAAKTPEERAALMKDHMKAMHDGMAMMGQMRGGMMVGGMGTGDGKAHMPMDPAVMQRRMDMMEMMMQMMMDRDGMKPPVAK
jgi:hypothetical protein